MIKASSAALAASLCCIASPALPATMGQAQAAAERVLGADNDEAQWQRDLPFMRKFSASGVVAGSLAESIEAAGVPSAALLEMTRAFATALDLERDVKNGDRFWVSHERQYTIAGNPIGIGRVLWAELHSSGRGTVAIHRFGGDQGRRAPFWLASGESTETSSLRLPLDTIVVSSGFGMRADPFDQPSARGLAMGPLRAPATSSLKAKPDTSVENVNVATPLGLAMGLSPGGGSARAVRGRGLFVMHRGVDFVADSGTPVRAAAGGVVTGAHPKGGYGNWIEIEHASGLTTVYGHLSSYAPEIYAGAVVEQGQVIGHVGSTGRSTGAHLHFELLVNGRPTDPMKHSTAQRVQLRGAQLERFQELVAANLAEAEHEGKPR
jgi:murein DD-endopeptidase MepM/ murein hydrolase activator NlpD